MLVAHAASGLSDSPRIADTAWLPVLLPFIYYGYCLISSIFSFKGPILLVTGILAHFAIVPFCFQAVRGGGGFFVIGPLILASCWCRMYLERTRTI